MGVLLLTLLLLLLVGCRQSAQPTAVSDAIITLTTDPAPPQTGEGILIITATEADGTPLDVTKVSVRGDMNHAGMSPEFGETESGDNGDYRIPFNWSMGGDWILEVTVTLADTTTIIREFEISVEN